MSKGTLYQILAVVAGVIFIGAGISENRHISRLKRFGTAAVVIPPDKYTDHSKNGSHTYTADISFKLADGSPVTVRHSLPSEALEAMKADRPVTVYYDARDATDFVFEQDSTHYWMPALGVFFLVAAGVMFKARS